MRVLVTGAAGRVGSRVSATLRSEHEVIGVDVRPTGHPADLCLDILDVPAVRDAAMGVDAVIHLAIVDGPSFGRVNSLQYDDASLKVHVIGTHNLLRAAADHKVERFLYASSVSAVDSYGPDVMVTSEHRHLGGGIYGVTKGFGEELCRMFGARRSGGVAVLRLGNVYIPELAPDDRRPYHRSRVHIDDVARAFSLGLTAALPPFCVVHIVGDNAGRRWDLAAAEDLLGWRPTCRFGEDGRPEA